MDLIRKKILTKKSKVAKEQAPASPFRDRTLRRSRSIPFSGYNYAPLPEILSSSPEPPKSPKTKRATLTKAKVDAAVRDKHPDNPGWLTHSGVRTFKANILTKSTKKPSWITQTSAGTLKVNAKVNLKTKNAEKPAWNSDVPSTDPTIYANRLDRPTWNGKEPLRKQEIRLVIGKDNGSLRDWPHRHLKALEDSTAQSPWTSASGVAPRPVQDTKSAQKPGASKSKINERDLPRTPPMRSPAPTGPLPKTPRQSYTIANLPVMARNTVPATDLLPGPINRLRPRGREHLGKMREAQQAKPRPPVQENEYANVAPGISSIGYPQQLQKQTGRKRVADMVKPESKIFPAPQGPTPIPIPPSLHLRDNRTLSAAAVRERAKVIDVTHGTPKQIHQARVGGLKVPAKEVPKPIPAFKTRYDIDSHQLLTPASQSKGDPEELRLSHFDWAIDNDSPALHVHVRTESNDSTRTYDYRMPTMPPKVPRPMHVPSASDNGFGKFGMAHAHKPCFRPAKVHVSHMKSAQNDLPPSLSRSYVEKEREQRPLRYHSTNESHATPRQILIKSKLAEFQFGHRMRPSSPSPSVESSAVTDSSMGNEYSDPYYYS